jgi:hypothetical protein
MDQAELIKQLEPDATYWIEFKSSKDGQRRWIAVTIHEVDGQLKGAGVDGEPHDLPTNIVSIRKMNDFIRLHWMSRQIRRQFGDHKLANILEAQAYVTMSDDFHKVRLERLCQTWNSSGGVLSSRIQEELRLLRQHRPTLNVDELPCVVRARRREIERRDQILDEIIANIIESDSPVDDQSVAQPSPSLYQRICRLFHRSK